MRELTKRLWMCLIAAGICGSVWAAGPKNGLKWQPDIFTAHQVSVRDNKPMLLVFGAEWCVFCKKLEQTTLAEPEMVKYINAHFVPVHIDVDKEKKVASILEVTSLPCTVVLSPDADVLGRIEGYAKAPALHRTLTDARRQQSQVSPVSAPAVR